jgi:hypothetical protein
VNKKIKKKKKGGEGGTLDNEGGWVILIFFSIEYNSFMAHTMLRVRSNKNKSKP